MSEQPRIEARGVSKGFREGRASVQVLESLDLQVAAGESVAILGASGSGKSTLLHVLGGLDTPSAGEVFVDGQAMASLSDACGVLSTLRCGRAFLCDARHNGAFGG